MSNTYRANRTVDDERESGFTLIELLVSSALAVLILTIAGSLLLSGLRTQETATSVTDATTSAQQIARSVQGGVRNASALSMTVGGDAGSELLLARVIGSGADSSAAHCQAWYYTPQNGGAVYMTTSTGAIAAPSGPPASGWTLLGTGVSPSTTGGPVFVAPSNSRVELTFKVAAAAHPYVLITTTTFTQQSTTVSAPCF
jgi:prepilin-type N-terminal cleavage/methylation domain-containing protein